MIPGRISVLCPSRGRPSHLRDSLSGLLDSAADRGGVEILVAMDPDDPERDVARWLVEPVQQISVWTAPVRFGYAQMHRYFNELAARAMGEWLMLWNDDAQMLTPGWDGVIRGEQPGILWPEADYAPEINTFPVWPAAWTLHLGHVSLDQSCDMWLADLGERTGTHRRIPVSIHHLRVQDVTDQERLAVGNVGTFHTPEMQQARAADAEKIRAVA